MRRWSAVLRTASTDWSILAFLLMVAAAAGVFYLSVLPAVLGDPSLFNPRAGECSPNFVTSVMMATGRGFVEPAEGDGANAWYPESPELSRFLRRESMHLSPSQIPDSFRTCQPRCDFSYRHRYLLYTVGALWRVFGISWHVVTALRIALYCALIGAVYGLMRLGMGRFWSAAGTFVTAAIPSILLVSDNVRDFGKGPFILVSMLAIGCLVKHPVRRSVFFGLAALLGLIIGIGVGFRADVLVCLPPALFALACCRRIGSGTAVGGRLVAMGLLCVSFLVPASFIMGVYSGGNLFAHDVLMGLATKCDDMLGTNRAFYEKLYVNDDRFVANMATDFSERTLPPRDFLAQPTDERGFLLRLAATFPGDLLTRGYSSVLWIVRGGVHSMWFGVFMAVCTAAVLFIIARRDLRVAWMTLVLLLYFCGYLSLQPERRHAFHLFFIPLWILGFLLDKLTVTVRKEPIAAVGRRVIRAVGSPRQCWTPSLRRMLWFAVPVIALLTLPLYAARAYQDGTVGTLLDAYATADLMPVEVKPRSVKGWTMFERSTHTPMHSGLLIPPRLFNAEYWVAEFAPDTQWRPIWLQYATGNAGVSYDWLSHGLWVAPGGTNESGNMRYFFPVIELTDVSQTGWALFAGIAVPKDQAGSFRGLHKVRNVRDFPLFLNMSFSGDRDSIRRHQTLFRDTVTELDNNVARYWLEPMPMFTVPPLNGVFNRDDQNGAIKAYQDGLASDPHNALLLLGLAASLEPDAETQEVIGAYRNALAADPTFFVTYHYIDAFFKRSGDTAGRIALWKEMARDHPGNYLPLFHLAMALAECHDVDGAIDAYRKVLELNPSDAGTLVDLGRLLEARNDVEAAIQAYQRASQIGPVDPQTADNLRALLARRGNHQ